MIEIPKTIYDCVRESAEANPDGNVYDFLGFTCTYRDFINEIDAYAEQLTGWGIKEGDIITAYLPNIPFSLVLFYAANKKGAIINFIHPLLPVENHANLLKKMNPRLVYLMDSMHDKYSELKAHGISSSFIFVKTSPYLTPFKKMLYKFRELSNNRKTKHLSVFNNIRLPDTNDNPTDSLQSGSDKTSLILLTGGTTGDSRGVCLSDKAVNLCAAQTASYRIKPETDDKMLAIMPVFHGFGLVVSIHTAILSAACVLLLPYYKNKLFKDTIKKKKPNYIIGVPRLFSRMVYLLNDDRTKLDFFKGLYCGGAALSDSLYEKVSNFLEMHGASVNLREGYGLTECVSACTLMPEGDIRKGSIGKPYPGVDIKIMDSDTGTFLQNGNPGEICINSETVMNGYFGEESKNIITVDGIKWLKSGDIGYMDEDGYIYFTDRIKRMIKIAGYEVYPAVIERLLNSVSHIDNSCVVESYKNGLSYLKAYIVTSADDRDNILTSLKRICSEKLPGYSIPGEFEFIDSIPETLLKKNDYRSLS